VTASLVDRIAKAVLYEGYLLYPYRPSALKNQQRFNFGVIYPRAYCEAHRSSELWSMQTECLVLADRHAVCTVAVRFLRMVNRSMETELDQVNDGAPYQAWQEAVGHEIEVPEFDLPTLAAQSLQWPMQLAAKTESTPIEDPTREQHGVVRREQTALAGMIEVSAVELEPGLFRLTTVITNSTCVEDGLALSRNAALSRSMVSAHTVFETHGGEFVSLIDPPERYAAAAHACKNVGTWPVLVGEPGQKNTLLSSPIILYDYPEVAPESPGDLFDGAEIDEILSLRIMTMTDDEKREMRESDDRARQILERTEALPPEQFMKLHGAIRGLRPSGGEPR
jgi:hypothetical protein